MNIIVLCGGSGPERHVSFSSGANVADALRSQGFNVLLLDVASGIPNFSPNTPFADLASLSVCPLPHSSIPSTPDSSLPNLPPIAPNLTDICASADIVFLATHGDIGENGKLQALFDLCNIKYTGSDSLSSAICMDKFFTKSILSAHSIPSPNSVLVSPDSPIPSNISFPCVVKPCSAGSSLGISIVHSPHSLRSAILLAANFDSRILIEDFIDGIELSVGIIDGHASPVLQILPISGFYDYSNKYQAGAASEICPAPIPPSISDHLQAISERIFDILNIKVYCRLDFRLDLNGNFFFLEANTLPGLTPHSLLPIMALNMGLSFPFLCSSIINLSLDKYSTSY